MLLLAICGMGWLMSLGLRVGGPLHAQQTSEENANDASTKEKTTVPTTDSTGTETITLANGCFWCTEAVFQQLKGVVRVKSGYTGGSTKNPTYEQVCTGTTGHAEAIQIEFDPSEISLDVLLDVFWHSHDPTTLNRQGHDVGTQYRSGIFYHTEAQRVAAEASKKKLDDSHTLGSPIVTEITPFTVFYPAEDYHDNYYRLNGRQPYCSAVVRPKVEKIQKEFKAYLK
jgi:peptide-methionine (S)-S-oxide reductase